MTPAGGRGFTLVEVLVTLAIVVLLLSLILTVLGRGRRSAQQVACLDNLREIGAAFQQYALDADDGALPNPVRLGTTWEACLDRYVGADAFDCPADDELAPVLGSSYDWRDTGDPLTTLAGMRPEAARADAVLAFDALPGWHAPDRMTVVTIGQAAAAVDAQEALGDLMRPWRR